MGQSHAKTIEELPSVSTELDRQREHALARAMASATAVVTDSSGGDQIQLDADDRRALRALFAARARGQRVSVVSLDAEISPEKAAGLLGVSRPMVYRLIERGDLPAARVGSHWRLRTADVVELADRRRVDLDFVEHRLSHAVEVGGNTAAHRGGQAAGDAKSDWHDLPADEKAAAVERARARGRRRSVR